MLDYGKEVGGLPFCPRILTPLAWAARTVILLIRGVKLLVLNWRLSLIQLVPAAWLWVVTRDLKTASAAPSVPRHLSLPTIAAAAAAVVAFSIAAFWCNRGFAFAIDGPPPPRIAPAVRQARRGRRAVAASGLAVGARWRCDASGPADRRLLGVQPGPQRRIGRDVDQFRRVPARIIGEKTTKKLPPGEVPGSVVVSSTVSAVVAAPGYLLGPSG